MRPEIFGAEVAAPRQHGLDLVRAAAIASVMAYHAKTMTLAPSSAPWLIAFGWMGVDLFFVLSGFLIASQLLKSWANGGKPNYPRFFVRRALRTIPAFAVMVLIYFAFPQLRETPAIQPFWQFATFTENLLFKATGPKAFDQVWSLCVEEQFYLLFPLALSVLAIRPSARKTITVLLAVLSAGIFVR
jgi:peptidoglycan/LPS O-acetylase OafA/YrhL